MVNKPCENDNQTKLNHEKITENLTFFRWLMKI